jgi:hypothetical protein
MPDFSLSDKYALGATLALLVLVLLNNPLVMLVISVAGLVAGALVARRGPMCRAAWVALIAFAVSLVFGIVMLLR